MDILIPSEGVLHRIRNIENRVTPDGCPIAAQCSLVNEVAQLREKCLRLEELSFVDGLTGLYNFRYMQKAIEMEMERTRRTKLPTSLIMIDLDHFKNINTLYGHECGNIALASTSKIVKDSVRVIDIPCRYGGEEFSLILPGTSLRQSTRIAERIRETIHSNPVTLKNESVTLTASFGVAVFRFTDDCTVTKFINRADNLLYQAKNEGRNRVCAEEPGPIFPPDEVTQDEKAALFTSFKPEE